MILKLFNDVSETWLPHNVTPAERAGLEAAAANAEWLSESDLKNLVRIVGTLESIDRRREEEAAQQQKFQEHFERERRREINEALRNAETEKQIKRARIAAALNIDPSEVNLD